MESKIVKIISTVIYALAFIIVGALAASYIIGG